MQFVLLLLFLFNSYYTPNLDLGLKKVTTMKSGKIQKYVETKNIIYRFLLQDFSSPQELEAPSAS